MLAYRKVTLCLTKVLTSLPRLFLFSVLSLLRSGLAENTITNN